MDYHNTGLNFKKHLKVYLNAQRTVRILNGKVVVLSK